MSAGHPGTLEIAALLSGSIAAILYTLSGGISSCRINPAHHYLDLLLSGRMGGKDAAMYMVFRSYQGTVNMVPPQLFNHLVSLQALMVVLRLLPVPMDLLTE